MELFIIACNIYSVNDIICFVTSLMKRVSLGRGFSVRYQHFRFDKKT